MCKEKPSSFGGSFNDYLRRTESYLKIISCISVGSKALLKYSKLTNFDEFYIWKVLRSKRSIRQVSYPKSMETGWKCWKLSKSRSKGRVKVNAPEETRFARWVPRKGKYWRESTYGCKESESVLILKSCLDMDPRERVESQSRKGEQQALGLESRNVLAFGGDWLSPSTQKQNKTKQTLLSSFCLRDGRDMWESVWEEELIFIDSPQSTRPYANCFTFLTIPSKFTL